jgi:hypothetical protein
LLLLLLLLGRRWRWRVVSLLRRRRRGRRRGVTGQSAGCAADQGAQSRAAAATGNCADRRAAAGADQGAASRALSRIIRVRAGGHAGEHRQAHRTRPQQAVHFKLHFRFKVDYRYVSSAAQNFKTMRNLSVVNRNKFRRGLFLLIMQITGASVGSRQIRYHIKSCQN